MPISYNEQERVFCLDTPHTTYLMGLAGSENFLGHIYYGPSVPDDNMAHVAACPSHINGRVTPFEIRGRLSLPG